MDSSKIVKTVILVTIAVLFLVSSIMALVSSSRLISETTKTYILGVESCEYKRFAVPLEPTKEFNEPERECSIDYNRAKGVLADTIAVLIVSLPLAIFTYRKLFKLYKE